MERWTITEASDGRYRLHINHGGKPFWCMFDFTVRPAPGCDGVEFVLASDADPMSAEWFPHLHRGMLCGLDTARVHGRVWAGARVEVRKVHTHPIDTTARGCEFYGFNFVLDVLPCRGVRLSE
ncbi:hypothetical protein [Zavarzinella formosa]|uniref:hypothetical protein n=1 Tax=Zavarzinella formosa TaxID=360055 RepID=UPI0002E422DF|nr:hypothetical protein [Zavarzinella formosa]